MSGLTLDTPRPTDIRLHQLTRKLEVTFDDGLHCLLPCEFLRVYSPSAEVRGHGAGQEVLQVGLSVPSQAAAYTNSLSRNNRYV